MATSFTKKVLTKDSLVERDLVTDYLSQATFSS